MSANDGILKRNSTPVQVYHQIGGANSSLLGRAFVAQAGGYLRVGDPVTMCYDHKDHQVVPLLNVSPNNDIFIMLADAEAATVVLQEVHTTIVDAAN